MGFIDSFGINGTDAGTVNGVMHCVGFYTYCMTVVRRRRGPWTAPAPSRVNGHKETCALWKRTHLQIVYEYFPQQSNAFLIKMYKIFVNSLHDRIKYDYFCSSKVQTSQQQQILNKRNIHNNKYIQRAPFEGTV